VLLEGLDPGVQAIPITATDEPMAIIEQLVKDPQMAQLHVLGHGAPGEVILGGQRLDAQTFSQRNGLLGAAATNPLQIAFWSCKTGHGDIGMNFINTVANATGAHVFASSGLVGHEDKGGSWALDVQAAPRAPFSADAREGFKQVLALVNLDKDVEDLEAVLSDALNDPDNLNFGNTFIVDISGMTAQQLSTLANYTDAIDSFIGSMILTSGFATDLSGSELSDLLSIVDPAISNVSIDVRTDLYL
jgi:hypothetical protein